MPTYDFRCPQGHNFERRFGRISEAPSEVACPECGELATRQISGGAGLIFKGSGFYITDYGKDGKKDQRAAAAASHSSKSDESKGGEKQSSQSSTAEGKGSAGGDSSKSGSGKSGESGGGSDAGSSTGQSSVKPPSPRPPAAE